jgi:predicted Rossmann-fold nucleotide-binding protein
MACPSLHTTTTLTRTPTTMQSFAVFCGSAPGSAPEYLAAARDVGTALAQQQRRLVYGGGERGL